MKQCIQQKITIKIIEIMTNKYCCEKMIYNFTKDVSDISKIENNFIKIRIIKRVKPKIFNVFRSIAKFNTYYDIEYVKPYTHNNNENICPTICAFEHEMWNAERICWILMSENCDSGVIIRKKQIIL